MQPVAIRRAVFCLRVFAVSGCHAVCACVSIGLMYCLYVAVMSSLECS